MRTNAFHSEECKRDLAALALRVMRLFVALGVLFLFRN